MNGFYGVKAHVSRHAVRNRNLTVYDSMRVGHLLKASGLHALKTARHRGSEAKHLRDRVSETICSNLSYCQSSISMCLRNSHW